MNIIVLIFGVFGIPALSPSDLTLEEKGHLLNARIGCREAAFTLAKEIGQSRTLWNRGWQDGSAKLRKELKELYNLSVNKQDVSDALGYTTLYVSKFGNILDKITALGISTAPLEGAVEAAKKLLLSLRSKT